MKSDKAFFLSMVALVIGLLILDWMRNFYFAEQTNAPLIRIKALFTIIAGTLIMKKFLSLKGFRIFLIGYSCFWIVYFVLNIAASHLRMLTGTFLFYKETMPLVTPLPFIFFWLIDKVFLLKKEIN